MPSFRPMRGKELVMIIKYYGFAGRSPTFTSSSLFEEQSMDRRDAVLDREHDEGRDILDTEFLHEPAAVGFDALGR